MLGLWDGESRVRISATNSCIMCRHSSSLRCLRAFSEYSFRIFLALWSSDDSLFLTLLANRLRLLIDEMYDSLLRSVAVSAASHSRGSFGISESPEKCNDILLCSC